ncbi:MAG: UDP-N-acetylglucosamine 1-carboxyvinyltransferase [Terriglobia bacterium]
MVEESFVINGGRPLDGEVKVSGAKNATLKLMAAAILSPEPTVIRNVPAIRDVDVMVSVLQELGFEVDRGDATLAIQPSTDLKCEASYELVNKMRASIGVLGPLLARLGEARVALPGGCEIGARKIDLHVRSLEALGARVRVEHGFITAESERLVGSRVSLDFPSVGATENLLMAAVLAEGTTHIENAAREPEIVDLANFLNSMGARIDGAGTYMIQVEGVRRLTGADYEVMPDRIEAGTFIMAAAVTGGEIYVEGAGEDLQQRAIERLELAGIELAVGNGGVHVRRSRRPRAVDVVTLPYPGFPTDLQPQVMVMLCLADGTSVITENVFESRFAHADQLRMFGSDISIQGHHAVVRGVGRLSPADVEAGDLRGGAALVLAALAAPGRSKVRQIRHVDRGYDRIEDKLVGLGADIRRVAESNEPRVDPVPAQPGQPRF